MCAKNRKLTLRALYHHFSVPSYTLSNYPHLETSGKPVLPRRLAVIYYSNLKTVIVSNTTVCFSPVSKTVLNVSVKAFLQFCNIFVKKDICSCLTTVWAKPIFGWGGGGLTCANSGSGILLLQYVKKRFPKGVKRFQLPNTELSKFRYSGDSNKNAFYDSNHFELMSLLLDNKREKSKLEIVSTLPLVT